MKRPERLLVASLVGAGWLVGWALVEPVGWWPSVAIAAGLLAVTWAVFPLVDRHR